MTSNLKEDINLHFPFYVRCQLFSDFENLDPLKFHRKFDFQKLLWAEFCSKCLQTIYHSTQNSRLFQKCNQASKVMAIWSFLGILTPQTSTSILVVGSKWVNKALWNFYMSSFGCFSSLDMTWSQFGQFWVFFWVFHARGLLTRSLQAIFRNQKLDSLKFHRKFDFQRLLWAVFALRKNLLK